MSEIDPEIRRLLVDKVASFEKLELLLLTCRDRHAWTPVAASRKLRVDETIVDVGLQELEAIGLLVRGSDGYRFQPQSPELGRAAEGLCTLYEEDRLLVVNLLTSAAFARIRTSAATVFADAFRIRKADPGDNNGGDHG